MKRQRGVALLMALLLVAIVGGLAMTLTRNNAFDLRRTMSVIWHDEGTQAAYGAESWVAMLLRDDAQDTPNDHLGELWAQELPVLPIESESVQGVLSGELVDLQGRFNVNNLVAANGEVDPLAVEQFRRLLIALELDPRFAGLAADWLDPDQDAGFPDGAEDPIYTSLSPPYRAANHVIATPSELMALEGMTTEFFNVLAPNISALPGRTPVNVNTAPAAVLLSLDENMSPAEVESLIAERAEGGIPDIENRFRAIVAEDVLPTLVGTSSFFQLKVVVQIATVRVTYYSVLYRDTGGAGEVVPILRSFGTI
ncbi:MAG TPA: type II secretion system minor pseudopilin GspK [Woeseiaceae bacterium]|nr:type II secretion system minor pseudopilin GspK [Woeseiaceae bacterium]